MPLLNDIHSQLNATRVAQCIRPTCIEDLRSAIKTAQQRKLPLSLSGGRHAMGGQQFATGGLHLDMTAMKSLISSDVNAGLLHVQGGAMWPDIMQMARAMRTADGVPWSIRQKQTGVNDVTLAGSISANAHGRGLSMPPLVEDIEDLTVVLANAEVLRCSRSEHPELFQLVVGGYGLFGIIVSATLRLTPLMRMRRHVDVMDLEDACNTFPRRIEQGYCYGDFQFVIDPHDPDFLTRGVMACYRPIPSTAHELEELVQPPLGQEPLALRPEDWLGLLRLAYHDKNAAFQRYAGHYLQTHGQLYASDAMQMATYLADYPALVQSAPAQGAAPHSAHETLVIGELYVPPAQLLTFMQQAQKLLRAQQAEVIYGTIRMIRADHTSFLAWAKQDYACIVFNLRTPHTAAGRARTADAFRALIDIALALNGSWFLTYHRYASATQLRQAYPQIDTFVQHKQALDPQQLFQSDWWTHITQQLAV